MASSARLPPPGPIELLAVALLLTLASVLVHAPYWPGCFVSDDQQHLERLADLELGRLGWFDYLFQTHNVHSIPLWKLWYWAMWRLFGLDTAPWHLAIALVHAAGAWALYVGLRAALAARLPALLGALLWSACALGKPDNPLCWIAASHLTFALAALLAALACLTGFHSPRWRAWALGCGAASLACVLSMGSLVVMLPMIPLAYWCGPRRPDDSRREQLFWLGCLAPAPLVALLLQLGLWGADQYDLPKLAQEIQPWIGVQAGVYHWPIALANLLGWPVAPPPSDGLLVKAVIAAAVLLVAFLPVEPNHRRLYLLALGSAALLTWLANVRGSYVPLEKLLASGRYSYPPTLAWCVVLAGLAATALASATPGERRLYRGLLVAAAMVFIGIQYRCAAQSQARFEVSGKLAAFREAQAGWREVLEQLAADPPSGGKPVRLPQAEVTFPMLPYRLSTVVVALNPDLAANFQVVPPEEFTASDRAAVFAALPADGQGPPQADELRRLAAQ